MTNRIGSDVAIVILNWNGSSDTLECIRSLRASDIGDARIALFDNGSRPEEVARIEGLEGVELHKSPSNLGFAEGNNEAVRRLGPGARTLVFLNNDTEVDKIWLGPVLDILRRKSSCIVSPAIHRGGPADPPEWWFTGTRIAWPLGRPILETRPPGSEPVELPYVPGCCLAIQREDWERLGGFDATYFAYFEDTDLCLRAAKLGIRSWMEPRGKIWHKVSRATGEYSPFRIELFTRNRILFMRRFAGRLDFAAFFLSQVAVRFAYSLKYFARKDGKTLYTAFVRGVRRGFSEKEWK